MIVTTTELFKQAYGKYAIGAYNINNMEQAVGLFRGNLGKSGKNDDPVDGTKAAPFIIQISRGARGYSDKRILEGLIRACDETLPEAIFGRSLLRLHRQRFLFLRHDRRFPRRIRKEHRDHQTRR